MYDDTFGETAEEREERIVREAEEDEKDRQFKENFTKEFQANHINSMLEYGRQVKAQEAAEEAEAAKKLEEAVNQTPEE